MLKHYIHCHEPFNLNKGGSVGYISSLFEAFRRRGDFTTPAGAQCEFIFPKKPVKNAVLPSVLDARLNITQHYTHAANSNLLNERKGWFRQTLPPSEEVKISPKLASIHIHGDYNFMPVFNTLTKMGVEGRVVKVLTTHNPYRPTQEWMYLATRNSNLNRNDLCAMEHYFKLRDKWAFTLADALFFPTRESMQGYLDGELGELICKKPLYFAPTGTIVAPPTKSAQQMRTELGISRGARVFVYIGRFIDVRGFDILLAAAREVVEKCQNAYFVVVGESGEPALKHKQWIQIPYTKEPQNFLNLADACVCANRGSLFDLSMIEILASKKPLICAKVGGFAWLYGRTDGAVFVAPNSADELADAILRFSRLGADEIAAMGEANFALYERELSLAEFAKNYALAVDKIHADFGITPRSREISCCENGWMLE